MKIEKWIDNNTKSLKGKTVAITGATGVLGREICLNLGNLGADLILLVRNMKKANALKKEIVDKFNNNVEILYVDQEEFFSVQEVCEELQKRNFDILILNAGAYHIPRKKTSIGYDNVYQINFISQYYMARKLLPCLEARKDSKVIVVGSLAHKDVKIDLDDIDYSKRKSHKKVYGNAKRFLMYSLIDLFKNQQNVKLAIVHPGIVLTNLMTNYSKIIYNIIKYPMKVVFMSPKKGCLSVIKGVFEESKGQEWIGPKFFNIWGYPTKKRLKNCKNKEFNQIARVSNDIYNQLNRN